MAFNKDGVLIRGERPEIYYVEDGQRRHVPDMQTLLALNKDGYGAVKHVPQRELEAIKIGPPMPPLFESTVLVAPDGEQFLANAGRLRRIPDAETAAILGRRRVAPISTADAKRFRAKPLEPREVGGSDPIPRDLPSVTDASAEALAIDAYIRSLASLPALPDDTVLGPITKRPGVTEVDGVDMEVTEQRVTMSRQVADFIEVSPIADVMWAGATVAGASVQTGSLAPIALSRAPGVITLTTDLTRPAARSQSRRLNAPTLASYVDAHNELLEALSPTDSAASISNQMMQISTLEEGMVSFGLNLKGAGWGVTAKASLNGKLERSTTFASFSQAYYQIAFTPEGSPPRFFADDVRLDDVKNYCGTDNPPCYVSSITYGRMLIFLLDSEKSSLEVQAAVTAAWTAAMSGDGNLSAEHRNTLQVTSVTAVVIGGSSGATGEVILDPVNGLAPWIRGQLQVTKDVPASPIQYTVRYLAAPHNLVRVTRTTDPVKIVDANVYGGREFKGIYRVGEGSGQGPVATGIRPNRGDQVIITATGTIWAGWMFLGRNGPEGLDGPPKPWYPIPNGDGGVRGSMLIAGYDNSNWFPVGSGKNFRVPTEYDDSELWLRLNDDDMTNGNGAFEVKVTLNRRIPTINAAG